MGGLFLLIGGALLIVGALLPWLKIRGETGNGLDKFIYTDSQGTSKIVDSPGSAWIFLAIVLIGLGIALYAAGRVLPVAIIAIVVASIALLLVFFGWSTASDTKDYAGNGSYGIGLPIGLVAAVLTLAGSIVATAKRRR
jgi:hypothetical protein